MPEFFRSKYINRNYKKAIQILGGNICNFSKLHIELSIPISCKNSILSILKIVNLNGFFIKISVHKIIIFLLTWE